LRKIIRTIRHLGEDSDVWPVVLLLFAVLVPAVCLLWFMGAAMRNERLAARQRLADVYRVQLADSQTRLQQYWKQAVAELERLATTISAPAAFAKCVQSGFVDGAVIFDEQGHVIYPNSPSAVNADFGDLEPKLREANRLEYLRKYLEAATRYDALARATANDDAAARAFQSEARCRVQTGQRDAVIQLVNEDLGRDRFRCAADLQGRLIVANAELLALELITNRTSPVFQTLARRLSARLADYENPALAASQRGFLMKELQRLSPEKIDFPTLAAEQLAAEVAEKHPNPARDSALQRNALPNVWQFTTPNRRMLALIRSDKLLTAARNAVAPENSLADINISLVPPDMDAAGSFVALPAGEQMPGWRLALSVRDREIFEASAGRQAVIYFWTAIFVMAGMGVLTMIALRLVRRRMRLARLKNDLAATISHEIKTPLSSMRVLVETLLDSKQFDEQRTREYLELIAQENQRLSRLIQKFLTFSRMERNRHSFHFSLLPPRQVVEGAIASMRGRFDAPGCQLDAQIDDNLPPVMADPDALAAALLNLVENAYKYSEENKHIVLRARADNSNVTFSVTDNGIGIPRGERRRIFQPFYRVDERLSRKGSGCGLGLSIVRFIATAHRGNVSVESEPGCGSTFRISLPIAPETTSIRKEAIA
jgi:signal transduction histidine kinase